MKIRVIGLLPTLLLVGFVTTSLAQNNPGPTCGPDGCQKPGLHQVIVSNDVTTARAWDRSLKSISVVLIADGLDSPGPTCGPSGCQKPGLQTVIVADGADSPGPTCGPSGCQKPGLRAVVVAGGLDSPGPTCGPSGCQKPGLSILGAFVKQGA